jgi:hypothetical protein
MQSNRSGKIRQQQARTKTHRSNHSTKSHPLLTPFSCLSQLPFLQCSLVQNRKLFLGHRKLPDRPYRYPQSAAESSTTSKLATKPKEEVNRYDVSEHDRLTRSNRQSFLASPVPHCACKAWKTTTIKRRRPARKSNMATASYPLPVTSDHARGCFKALSRRPERRGKEEGWRLLGDGGRILEFGD